MTIEQKQAEDFSMRLTRDRYQFSRLGWRSFQIAGEHFTKENAENSFERFELPVPSHPQQCVVKDAVR